MTIETLIHTVLRDIRLRFYGDRTREFCRDRNALIKGIARYGHECYARGWELQPDFIARDIVGLLKQVQVQGGPKGYLPTYLEGAVNRHVGLRAEELSEEAKLVSSQVSRTVAGIRKADVPPPGSAAVEVLDKLWRQMKAGRPRKQTAQAAKQGTLL